MRGALNTNRRGAIGAICGGMAAVGGGWPLATLAQNARPSTAAQLGKRLKSGGVGLLAVEVEGKDVFVTPQGERSGGSPLPGDALFEIGSVTKTFTALLLAEAVVEKRLQLDGAVEEALGGIKLRDAAGDPIRWVDLATQRSGLPRLPPNLAPAKPEDPYADYDEAKLRAFLSAFKPTVVRNTRYEYSNLGFGLLGHALARQAGKTYAELLDQRVLQPLGLSDAMLALSSRHDPPRLVPGHDAGRKPVPHWHFDVLAPCGALLMSGAGLGRYAQAAIGAFDHPLREAFALCLKEHAPGPGPINPIGLAWLRAPLNDRIVMNHDGGTFGFSTSLWLDPKRQRAAAIVANAFVEVNDLALHLMEPAIPAKDFSLTQQATVSLGTSALEALAGVYALNPQFKISITVHDGQLFAQATGQGAFPIFAKTARRFFAKVTPLEIEFQPAEGMPSSLRLFQGGNTLDFKRE
jgi:D-alanyl-D-alanine-carboxypeptidase/D-alanyl-D-alanine-endopeptidase